jgi:hypothetical protein
MPSNAHWPADLTPETAVVYTHNHVETTLSAEALWATLVNAVEWPSWYGEASKVSLEGGESTLQLGSVIHWKTLGMRITSEVVEFEPARSLAWTASGALSRGFHRFDFLSSSGGGCLVTTEETERGLGPRLIPRRLKHDLERAHQTWLEELVKRASAMPKP